jgi:hypothetical protein
MGCVCGKEDDVREAPEAITSSEPEMQTSVDGSVETNQRSAPSKPAVVPQYKIPKYEFCGPSVEGEAFECFKGGLLYRIVVHNDNGPSNQEWHFYNDTADFETIVEYIVGPASTLRINPDLTQSIVGKGPVSGGNNYAGHEGWTRITMSLMPGETKMLFAGIPNGFKSDYRAVPLTDDQILALIALNERNVELQIAAVRAVMRKANLSASATDEQILAACVAAKVPFVDVHFPPTVASLCRETDEDKIGAMVWMRPGEYVSRYERDAIRLVHSVEPDDIDQGRLGDCWFLCAVSALAEQPSNIRSLFRHKRTAVAKLERQAGAYRVTFNKHGWWHSVIVDDFLPMGGTAPAFAHNLSDKTEMWAAMVEKAYAKLHGSYAAITAGDALHAMQDLTGYPTARWDEEWHKAMEEGNDVSALFDAMLAADKQGHLMILNTPGDDPTAYLGSNGLVSNTAEFDRKYAAVGLGTGHAYSLLAVKEFPQHNVRLLQIRNPWGDATEWTGAWGDSSELWAKHPDVAAQCKRVKDDGTFWMEWSDVKAYFDGGGVCFYKPTWVDYRVRGVFERGVPSVSLELTVTRRTSVMLVLSQRDKRGEPADSPLAVHVPMMLTLAVPDPDKNRPNRVRARWNSTSDADRPSDKFSFSQARDLAIIFTLEPSELPYVVIPRLYDSQIARRDYTLGLISERKVGDGFTATFKALPASCKAFRNVQTFDYVAAEVPSVATQFQSNPDFGVFHTREGDQFVHVEVPTA